MKGQIEEALKKSLISDQKLIKQATATINALRRNKGFFITLMQIADQSGLYAVEVRQSALANLKVSIERRWIKTEKWKPDFLIDEEQKAEIRKHLLAAVLRCNKEPKFLNLYKAIVKQIVAYENSKWLPVQEVLNALGAANPADPSTIPSILHFTMAMFSAFEMHMDERRNYMEEMLTVVLPVLFTVVQSHRTLEIIYLVTKIVWKSMHMQLGPNARNESLRWIPLVTEALQSSHPQLSALYNQEIKKYTQEYYYFHIKKWSARMIWRFTQRHANYKYHKQNRGFSDIFYGQFGAAVVESLVSQIDVPTIDKTKYFVLKALNAIAETRPQFLESYAADLLYVKLPPFLTLTPKDNELAENDPMELLKREMDPVQGFTNVKRAATDVWIALNEAGSEASPSSEYVPGKHLFTSMDYLKSKLNNNSNLLEKEMAMYVLCQMWTTLFKVKAVKQALPLLIDSYIIPEFGNAEMFLRARAVEVFSQYGTIDFPDIQVLQRAVDGIYRCLSSDPTTIVRIKAACSFNCILSHPEAIDMVRPHLNSVLTIYVGMLEKYDLEDVVASLEGIVSHFDQDIGPFAAELIVRLSAFFLKYCQIDQEKSNSNNDYQGEVEMAASGCLSAIAKILGSPFPSESIQTIEPSVVEVVAYSLTDEGVDFLTDAMLVLGTYLSKVQTITQQMWFFYPTLIYYIVGVQNMNVNAGILQNLPTINSRQVQIFKNLAKEKTSELHEIIPSLRFFVAKGLDVILTQTDFCGEKLIVLLFKLADYIYKASDEGDEVDANKASITSLFVHFLECSNNQEVLSLIWKIVKANLQDLSNKPRFFKIITSELIALCLYRGAPWVLATMEAENCTSLVMDSVIENQHRFYDEWQKQRIMLGLSTLFRLPSRPLALNKYLPVLFRWLCNQTRAICDLRTPGNEINNENIPSEPSEGSSSQDADFDWSQNHQMLYSSPFQRIDEVAYFEESMGIMQAQSQELYLELLKSLGQEQVAGLQGWVKKAKEQFTKQMKSIK